MHNYTFSNNLPVGLIACVALISVTPSYSDAVYCTTLFVLPYTLLLINTDYSIPNLSVFTLSYFFPWGKNLS